MPRYKPIFEFAPASNPKHVRKKFWNTYVNTPRRIKTDTLGEKPMLKPEPREIRGRSRSRSRTHRRTRKNVSKRKRRSRSRSRRKHRRYKTRCSRGRYVRGSKKGRCK